MTNRCNEDLLGDTVMKPGYVSDLQKDGAKNNPEITFYCSIFLWICKFRHKETLIQWSNGISGTYTVALVKMQKQNKWQYPDFRSENFHAAIPKFYESRHFRSVHTVSCFHGKI